MPNGSNNMPLYSFLFYFTEDLQKNTMKLLARSWKSTWRASTRKWFFFSQQWMIVSHWPITNDWCRWWKLNSLSLSLSLCTIHFFTFMGEDDNEKTKRCIASKAETVHCFRWRCHKVMKQQGFLIPTRDGYVQ